MPAGRPEAGDGAITIQFGMFDMDDSGAGNPFLDESLTVLEGVVIYDYQVADRLGVSTTLTYAQISSASIERLSNYAAHSGASGDYYAGADVAFTLQHTDHVTLGWHLGGSEEFDYGSYGAGGSLTVEAPDRNSSWTYSLEAFFDTVDIVRFDATDEPSEERMSVAGTVSYYRVLNERMNSQFGLTLSNQSGFLETPYNAVVLEDPGLPPNPQLANNARGVEITEELPGSRTRAALFGRVRYAVELGTALELGGRLYTDTWDVHSITLEPRILHSLGERAMVGASYRLYAQTEADDFDDEFLLADPTPEHRTQNSALGRFNSNTFGLQFNWAASQASSWRLGLDYTTRSDGLDAYFLTLGWNRLY